MKGLLNEHTGTVHKRQPGTTSGETACGALRHAPQQRISLIASDGQQREGELKRCGRCFEETGGY